MSYLQVNNSDILNNPNITFEQKFEQLKRRLGKNNPHCDILNNPHFKSLYNGINNLSQNIEKIEKRIYLQRKN